MGARAVLSMLSPISRATVKMPDNKTEKSAGLVFSFNFISLLILFLLLKV